MVSIHISYKGDLRCEAVHCPSSSQLLTDAPVDNQGKGEAFSPTDLCATATGSCMATIMGIRARDLGIDISGMRIRVDKVMSPDLPRRISQLIIDVNVPFEPDPETKAALVDAARNCPMQHSLHPDIERCVSFSWGQLAQ